MPEWDRIWPEWLDTMNNFRLRRLERSVYQSRRRSLVDEYRTYVTSPSPNTPSFDLLPHVADVARFPPFRDIIRASEETQTQDKLFESAFAQLPEFVDEWRKRLETELAELVQIPSHLSSNNASGGQVLVSNSTASSKSSQAPTDKLRLACALFYGGSKGIFSYPEVFSTSMCLSRYPSTGDEGDHERTGSIRDRFGIKYVEEAPYIVHVCGLDPNVATAEDMDRRNARLKCLSRPCSNFTSSWSWRDAVRLTLYRAGVICGAERWCCMVNNRCGTGMLPSPVIEAVTHAGSSSATMEWTKSGLPAYPTKGLSRRVRRGACYAGPV
jgi:hypothetical protein